MKKIPTIFVRDSRGKITTEENPACKWVFNGEGIATEKLDGTNVRLTIREGQIVRVEKRRNPTRNQKAEGIYDPWYVDSPRESPNDKHIWAAVEGTRDAVLLDRWPDGEHCCEAMGPKIQGNPLDLETARCHPFNLFPPMGWGGFINCTYDLFELSTPVLQSLYSPGHLAEGVVFHHPDGRRAKIKRKDFLR